MTTQLAATPIIRGSEALKIWEEAHHEPSEKAKENAKKLAEYFGKMMEGYDFDEWTSK